jgi:HAD superfamily hydrolase (TIGR01509 family)
MYRAVFMDIDGTMLDSNLAHARSWAMALQEKGYDIPVHRILPLIGMGGDKVVCELTGRSESSPEGHELVKRSGDIFRERFLAEQRPFPHIRELLERWRERGMILGVATSGGAEAALKLLEQAGVDGFFDCQVTIDDVDASKPDPDILHAALAKCGVAAERAVLIGDTPYDVQAARRAGVACIGVRCGGRSAGELEGAIAVFADPAEILARLDEPPLSDWFPGPRAT